MNKGILGGKGLAALFCWENGLAHMKKKFFAQKKFEKEIALAGRLGHEKRIGDEEGSPPTRSKKERAKCRSDPSPGGGFFQGVGKWPESHLYEEKEMSCRLGYLPPESGWPPRGRGHRGGGQGKKETSFAICCRAEKKGPRLPASKKGGRPGVGKHSRGGESKFENRRFGPKDAPLRAWGSRPAPITAGEGKRGEGEWPVGCLLPPDDGKGGAWRSSFAPGWAQKKGGARLTFGTSSKGGGRWRGVVHFSPSQSRPRQNAISRSADSGRSQERKKGGGRPLFPLRSWERSAPLPMPAWQRGRGEGQPWDPVRGKKGSDGVYALIQQTREGHALCRLSADQSTSEGARPRLC